MRTVNILVGWRKSGGQALVMKLNFKRHVHTPSFLVRERIMPNCAEVTVSVFFAPSSSSPSPLPPLSVYFTRILIPLWKGGKMAGN